MFAPIDLYRFARTRYAPTPYEDRHLLLSRAMAARAVDARLRSHGCDGDADRPHGRVRVALARAAAGRVSLRLARRVHGPRAVAQHRRHPLHAHRRAAD